MKPEDYQFYGQDIFARLLGVAEPVLIATAADEAKAAMLVYLLNSAASAKPAPPPPIFERTYEIASVGFGEVDLKSVQKFPVLGKDNAEPVSDHVTIGNLSGDLQQIIAKHLLATSTLTLTIGAAWDK